MGFLDNSGDIILDAVLTDEGRKRLAKGDCSFNISKFALGDDEINYTLYNKNHPSGSQYYDLEILQTPVLEAFTNNTSTMNSRLVSIPRNNVYYLPIMKLYNRSNFSQHANGSYNVLVDMATVDYAKESNSVKYAGQLGSGLLNGYQPGATENAVAIDQGIDNALHPRTVAIPNDLRETAFIVQMDNRLISLVSAASANQQTYSFIDDDQIAMYYVQSPSDLIGFLGTDATTDSTILGSRGARFSFRLKASNEVASSYSLFERIGRQTASGANIANADGTAITQYWSIDTNVRITGITTGYRIDIPVKLVKYYT